MNEDTLKNLIHVLTAQGYKEVNRTTVMAVDTYFFMKDGELVYITVDTSPDEEAIAAVMQYG